MGVFVKHIACSNPNCNSSDGNALYEDGSTYCWVCHTSTAGEKIKDSGKYLTKGSKVDSMTQTEEKKNSKPPITEEQKNEIKEKTSYYAGNYRKIRDDVYKAFGVRHSAYDSGELAEQYYPITKDNTLVGYKVRQLPKTFGGSIGQTGSDCDLFGQFKFQKPGRYIVITEGEIDAMSAYQMLKDYNHKKGWDQFETAVVSPTTGAQSTKQIAAQYKFLDQFEQIIISYDNDKAGTEAVEKLIPILPKGKVRIMHMRLKDANEYLKQDQQDAFIRDFYDAEKYMPVGVVGSSGIMERILSQTAIEKIPFPDLLPLLNEMIGGGIPLGHIVNIAAKTGIGKTTMINEFVYFWIFNSPHKVGVVSMELDTGQYGEVLLSRHLRRKLAKISDLPTKLALLNSADVQAKANELFLNSDGTDRFYLLDNRDGSLEEIKATIEELVVSCGCKVIVLDPIQDLLAGLSVDEQEEFMKWMKGFIKSHKVTFMLINHVRKSATGADASFTEEDIQGSSTIIKSASVNILLFRDKTAEDPIERNTTKALMSKNRITGDTGPCGEIYYDNDTHSVYDKQFYFANVAPEKF